MSKLLCAVLLVAATALYSCEGKEGNPVSTPIDSTNTQGTAPVEYGKPDSASMLPDASQGEGHRANTPGGDSVPSTQNK